MAEKAQIRLSRGAADGDATWVESLLCTHPEMNLNAPTPLHDDPISPGSDYGLTALHRAVKGNHAGVVKVLLKAGASHLVKTAAGKTPEDLAEGTGRKTVRHIFEAFRKRLAKPVCTPAQGRSAVLATRLAVAVNNQDIQAVKKWLDSGAPVLKPAFCEHNNLKRPVTAVQRAAWEGDPEILGLLLRKSKKAANAKDSSGYTALHYLASKQKWGLCGPAAVRCFKLLFAAGADPDAKNDRGDTPADIMGFLTPQREVDIKMACLFADSGSRGNLTKALEYAMDFFLCDTLDNFDRAGVENAARMLAAYGADPEVLRGFKRLYAQYDCQNNRTIFAVQALAVPGKTFYVGLPGHCTSPPYITYKEVMHNAVSSAPKIPPFFVKVARELMYALWTPQDFSKQPQSTRRRVLTVLRCAYRLSNSNEGYHLPTELWTMILGWIPRNNIRWPFAL